MYSVLRSIFQCPCDLDTQYYYILYPNLLVEMTRSLPVSRLGAITYVFYFEAQLVGNEVEEI